MNRRSGNNCQIVWQRNTAAKPSGTNPTPQGFPGGRGPREMSPLQKSGLPTHFLTLVDEKGKKLPIKNLPACQRAFLEVIKAHVPPVKAATVNGQTIYYYP